MAIYSKSLMKLLWGDRRASHLRAAEMEDQTLRLDAALVTWSEVFGAGRGERVSKKSKWIDVTSNVLYRVRSLTQIHKMHSDNQWAVESPGWGDDSKFAPVRYGRSGSAEKQQQHTNTAKVPLWLAKANIQHYKNRSESGQRSKTSSWCKQKLKSTQ